MADISSIKRPETLKDIAYREIRNVLSEGRAHNNLLTANGLASELGVSRTPVREALLQLAHEGILEAIDGRGFQVRKFSEKEIRSFFEARRVIELYVVKSIVDKLDEEKLDQIENMIARMRRYADPANHRKFLREDEAFHLQLTDWQDNKCLKSFNEQLRMLVKILGQRALLEPGRSQQVIDEHQAIVKALGKTEPSEAARAMEIHLRNTEEQLLKGLRQAESGNKRVCA